VLLLLLALGLWPLAPAVHAKNSSSSRDRTKPSEKTLAKQVAGWRTAPGQAAALPPEGWTPVALHYDGVMGDGLNGVVIEFCMVRFDLIKANPAGAPFHANAVTVNTPSAH
jgi:hypothetical protein